MRSIKVQLGKTQDEAFKLLSWNVSGNEDMSVNDYNLVMQILRLKEIDKGGGDENDNYLAVTLASSF